MRRESVELHIRFSSHNKIGTRKLQVGWGMANALAVSQKTIIGIESIYKIP
jgi:hypothetical protein